MKYWMLKNKDNGEIQRQIEDKGEILGFYKTKKQALADRNNWHDFLEYSLVAVRVMVIEII